MLYLAMMSILLVLEWLEQVRMEVNSSTLTDNEEKLQLQTQLRHPKFTTTTLNNNK